MPPRIAPPLPSRNAAIMGLAMTAMMLIGGMAAILVPAEEGASLPDADVGDPDALPYEPPPPDAPQVPGPAAQPAAPPPAPDPGEAPPPPGSWLRFGIGQAGVEAATAAGARPDYAQLWAGAWNQQDGWSQVGRWAAHHANQGIVPVVEWWYWGDEIRRSCVERGCSDGRHTKTLEGWRRGSEALADALHEGLAGRPGVLVLETEFNKADITSWERFDGLLAEQAGIFRQRAPELTLVLGFGNWYPEGWATFDRAAAAVDMVGLQAMRASTRNPQASYEAAPAALVAGAQKAQALFGKPVLVHDVALSSWPDEPFLEVQARTLEALLASSDELVAAGVVGIVYRAMEDDADKPLAEYFGEAERHWGLQRADGTPKPALAAWVEGVQRARGGRPG